MAFHFSLQPVLRLRLSLEERERLRLALIIGYLNQLNAHRQQLDEDKLQISNSLAERLKVGLLAAELHFERARMSSIDKQKQFLLQQIAKLEQQRVAQEQAFREAQRNRKILEKLREDQYELYRLELARREQQRVDDLFGLRHARLEKS